jgi:NSS family neurotransmitter:Na+ symporter
MTTVHRDHWSNRWAFVMATAGSAVGLGNIWKFPYMAGENGGGAFVLLYLGCVAVVGLPMMITEIMLGRRAQRNPVDGMAHLAREAGSTPAWGLLGLMGVLAGVIILSFYGVVAGWMIDYLVKSATGALSGLDADRAQALFGAMLADPYELLLWNTVFLVMTLVVVAYGVTKGLERANKILMPALFGIVLVLVGYGLAEGAMDQAAAFLFAPDFRRITPGVVLAAMGQAFFSLSLGMGAVMVYGSYLQRHVSIGRTAFYIALADTSIAILAGLAIFAIVFAHGLAPAAGPGLVMLTLPIAFGNMPGGAVIGALFFVLLTFAAWTSSISLVEPAAAWLSERLGFRRGRACLLIGVVVWLLGVAVALSFGAWSKVTLFGLGIFDALDYLASNVMLPLGAMLMALFAAWVMKRGHAEEELALRPALFRVWRLIVRFVTPVAIGLVFLNVTGLLRLG